ncbi:trans-sulfuration enzyme family protein [Neolewinella litorea]|uniref:Aminotransferase class I/II-fold pyridoxal phosphate-dependent enzyme n=1 Tax=Neolewinella litorea TaxID=2562452 RepID=A0A4S4NRF4_9BACT|nr:aminotransferase class I/II-fold pyridoxal phosphate-dependent enzyme [Neolewinella litorea]THH41777.1 aminotransferase class I/II-fold pyridoxal phosphate-dependent enzyme [Neolewinella litorea]
MKISSFVVKDPPQNHYNHAHQVPLVAASSFVFDTIEQGINIFDGVEKGHIYGRFGNPTVDAAADKIAALENHGLDGEAFGLFCASGMAAISTVLAGLCQSGDIILTQGDLYGGSSALIDSLTARGVRRITADLRDTEKLEDILSENPSLNTVYVETPSNPTLRCTDLVLLANLTHHYGARLVVDNTFATPIGQQPLKHGADVVVHSTTKYLNGHGTGVAGAIVTRDKKLMEEVFVPIHRLHGGTGNAWDAWLVLNGLKTLALRMERHSSNAERVAEFLMLHPRVAAVNYPGLPGHPDCSTIGKQMILHGGMLSFELVGGLPCAKSFMNRLTFCTLTPTLGDVDTLVLHPSTMSHRSLDPETRLANGITDGLIRLSIGIEHVEDIISDLKQALN